MPPTTYLIDLVEAKLPKEFGFPELGIDGDVLLNIMAKSALSNEDLIYDFCAWMQKMQWHHQSDCVLDQYHNLRAFLWEVVQKQPMQGVPKQFRSLTSSVIMNEYAALTFLE